MGLENIGIKLSYGDCKLIFDYIDYDKEGEIDYNKFLLLNTDNKKFEKIKYMEKKKKEWEEVNRSLKAYEISEKSISENSMSGLFGDGIIPKNKSLQKFH